MARELLRPEDATNWDDFLDRIALERAARNTRRKAFPAVPRLLLVISLVPISYAAGGRGAGWLWAAAIVPLAVLGWMAAARIRRTEADDERLKELDKLELAWKSHLGHPRR